MLARERFKATLGPEAARLIDINTIDGFQGREKDVAIFTCVRSNPKKGIGFVADFRRMNVGITRARASMLVVGSAAALKRDKHWAALIKHARATDCVFQVTPRLPRLSSASPALFCFLQSCAERSFLLVVLLQHRCRARVLDIANSPIYFFLRRHTIVLFPPLHDGGTGGLFQGSSGYFDCYHLFFCTLALRLLCHGERGVQLLRLSGAVPAGGAAVPPVLQ